MKESQLIVLLPQDEEELHIKRRSQHHVFLQWIWVHKFKQTLLTVSLSSMTLEKKNHQQTLAIWRKETAESCWYYSFNNCMFYLSNRQDYTAVNYDRPNTSKWLNLSIESLAYPHCQRTGAVIYRLAAVAVVWEPGCDQELWNIHTITWWMIRHPTSPFKSWHRKRKQQQRNLGILSCCAHDLFGFSVKKKLRHTS